MEQYSNFIKAPAIIIAESGATVNININNSANQPNLAVDTVAKFTEKKCSATRMQTYLYDLYARENPRKAANIAQCGSFLQFRQYLDGKNTTRLKWANFCKHPLCPMCSWRYSLKWAKKLYPACLRLREQGFFLYHLILTMPNVENLSKSTISDLRSAKSRFFRSFLKPVAFCDSIEITHGKRGFHPHIHAIIATATEWKTDKESIEMLRKEWRKYMPSPYDYTIAAMYPIRDMQHDVSEVCKYIFKGTEKINKNLISDIAEATHSMRKINVSKRMSEEIKKAKAISDEEEKKLIENLEACGYIDFQLKWNREKNNYIRF